MSIDAAAANKKFMQCRSDVKDLSLVFLNLVRQLGQ
jgi:hypothetical protein